MDFDWDDVNSLRGNIIRHVEIVASQRKQLDWEAREEVAWVPWELIECWFDLYHPGNALFELAFNDREKDALAQFDIVMEYAVKRLPDTSVQDMLDNEDWQRIMAAAAVTLKVTGRTSAN